MKEEATSGDEKFVNDLVKHIMSMINTHEHTVGRGICFKTSVELPDVSGRILQLNLLPEEEYVQST